MRIHDLDTPALLIDLDVMERNLGRAAGYAREHDLRLRPHTKTHKTPALGRRQLDLGAAGLSVAKVGEAEVMLQAAPPELLVAYPVVGRGKLERLMDVAKKTRVTVALDNLQVARGLSDAARAAQVEVGILAEMDAGMGRVGVAPGEDLLSLVQGIARMPRLEWEGIAFFPGHIRCGDTEEGKAQIEELSKTVRQVRADLKRAGFTPRIVSGGSTPTLYSSHLVGGVDEIRPGTYIFNDRNTWLAGACALEDCAATVLCTVVSTARKGQMIVDSGTKTFSSDRALPPAEASFGHVLEDPDIIFVRMNEEHGYMDLRRAAREFTVGDRVRIIPNHVCAAVNLHETVYGTRGEEVVESWRVEGRGKLQ